VGCKYCIEACPYKVRVLNHHEGVVTKCWLCIDMVSEGGVPACVSTCPNQVRIFGDLDDPDSDISRFVAKYRAQPPRADLNTKPKIFYKRS
jgi:Fe-S-cluster-containing dehydrogenase component